MIIRELTRQASLDLLTRIYDAEIEAAGRDAYGRDYMALGFANWA